MARAPLVYLLLLMTLAATLQHVTMSSEINYMWTKNEINYDSTGVQLVGHDFAEFGNTRIITECARHCIEDYRCISFNFDDISYRCQLNDASDLNSPEDMQDNDDSTFIRKGAFTIDMAAMGHCLSMPCGNNGECLDVVTAEGVSKFMCVCKEGWTGEQCNIEEGAPVWSDWTDYSACSVSCGSGWMKRTRTCLNSLNNQQLSVFECYGAEVDMIACPVVPCPVWDSWSDWSACSTHTTCGHGNKSRQRSCLNNGEAGVDRLCMGPGNESAPCDSPACTEPVRVMFGSAYGEGIVEVYDGESWGRVCAEAWDMNAANVLCKQMGFPSGAASSTYAASGVTAGEASLSGVTCSGTEASIQACKHDGWMPAGSSCPDHASVSCIVDGSWSDWSEWATCSATCASGIQERSRACDSPAALNAGQDCQDAQDDAYTKDCTMDPCPVDAYWDTWSDWSQCNMTCGGGHQSRQRTCVPAEWGGQDCDGPAREQATCNTQPCPVNGYWDPWAEWSSCTVDCGGGSQERSRTCVQPANGGEPCEGSPTDSRTCNEHECPVDGVWLEWSLWSTCSQSCGSGEWTRTRQCDGPFYEGEDCHGEASQTEECFIIECPVNGYYDPWSPWGECTVSCAEGERSRSRECNEPAFGGTPCSDEGEATQTEPCDEGPCPVDGYWEDWSTWDTCSKTCDTGVQYRTRDCVQPIGAGAPCAGEPEESQTCRLTDCMQPGDWKTWGAWSRCSATCGTTGVRTRERLCDFETYGNMTSPCLGESTDQMVCNRFSCTPTAATCHEWRVRGMEDPDYAFVKPASTEFLVRCYFNTTTSSDSTTSGAVTEVDHSARNRTMVDGYEPAGSYSAPLVYSTNGSSTISSSDIADLISKSQGCRQHIKWECRSASIHNPTDASMVMTYWKNRNGVSRSYFAGDDPMYDGCECGLSSTGCELPGKMCQCDTNDEVLRVDAGYITYMPDLPITAFLAGDTGNGNEHGFHTIGALECWGQS